MLTGSTMGSMPVSRSAVAAHIAFEPGNPAPFRIEHVDRDRGHACDKAISAERDPAASRPDEVVWILTCSNARYRVRYPGDTAPQVEPLD